MWIEHGLPKSIYWPLMNADERGLAAKKSDVFVISVYRRSSAAS
jgi:hypothetical protein